MSCNANVCWICLQPQCQEYGTLSSKCSCSSMLVHDSCLLRWQVYSSGKDDERQCRFCKGPLPDWRKTLPSPAPVAPMMSINFNNCTYYIQADIHSSGQQFQEEVRALLQLPADTDLDITFECKMPGQGAGVLELHGMHSYEAAMYCASAAASGHLATSSSTCSSSSSSHTCLGSSSSGSSGSDASDSNNEVWYDVDGWDDSGGEEQGLLIFSNAIAVQLAECASAVMWYVVAAALGIVNRVVGLMLQHCSERDFIVMPVRNTAAG